MKHLDDFIEHGRPRPMYNSELHGFGLSLTAGEEANSDTIGAEFIETFDAWLAASRMNILHGLQQFTDRSVIQGVTQFIDDLYLRHHGHVYHMTKDYLYHQRLYGTDFVVHSPNDIPPGGHLIIGMPFPFYGDIHPDMPQVLDACAERDVSVHIDSAWIGCTRDIDFDYAHPAIASIGFSLSKGLGLGYNRIGVRYCRQRPSGSITIMNDFTMIPRVMCWWGIQFIQRFGPDYLQNKYGQHYAALCESCNLIPSKSIHLAHINDDGQLRPVGTREALKHLHANANR